MDRTRSLTNNSGHCLETHTGPHIKSHNCQFFYCFHDSTRLPSKTSGHCFETNAEFQLENVDTTTSSTMVRNDVNTRNLPFHIRSYRPRHLESPCNTSKVRTRSTTHHSLLGKSKKGYYLRNRNMGECSCCNSSQDD